MSKLTPWGPGRPPLLVFVVSVLSAAGAASVGAAVAALAIGPIAPRNPDIIAIAAALREVISRPLRRGIAAHGSTTSVPAVEPCCGVAGVSVLPLGCVCSPASLISLLPLNKKRDTDKMEKSWLFQSSLVVFLCFQSSLIQRRFSYTGHAQRNPILSTKTMVASFLMRKTMKTSEQIKTPNKKRTDDENPHVHFDFQTIQ